MVKSKSAISLAAKRSEAKYKPGMDPRSNRGWPLYTGSLNTRLMSSVVRRAYWVWAIQGARCYNPKNDHYPFYGARGVRRLYSSRDFIGWFLHNLKKFKGHRPSINRINNDGNYEFGNIEIVSLSDNIKERNDRRGNPGRSHKKVYSVNLDTGKRRLFSSKIEAALEYGINPKTVYNHCQGKTKQFFKFGRRVGVRYTFKWV